MRDRPTRLAGWERWRVLARSGRPFVNRCASAATSMRTNAFFLASPDPPSPLAHGERPLNPGGVSLAVPDRDDQFTFDEVGSWRGQREFPYPFGLRPELRRQVSAAATPSSEKSGTT